MAAIFIPSLGTTDIMPQVDPLNHCTQQDLQDSEKAISALNGEQIQIRKVILQSRLALGILMASQGGINKGLRHLAEGGMIFCD